MTYEAKVFVASDAELSSDIHISEAWYKSLLAHDKRIFPFPTLLYDIAVYFMVVAF
jgi:hypothetical protein